MKFRNYKECIDYLFALERSGIKYDLKNIKRLSALDGNPHRRFKSIHVAGTNGKGSTASIVSSVLTEKGIRTGLYTSPHVKDFRERIRVNGKMISKDYVIKYTETRFKDIQRITPSFFEATTAMAFRYFADSGVDIAVIECGLGGRLDSTNIITPLVSVITSISIDHTEYLGGTLKEIAFEKAGIVKKNVPCVIGRISPYALRQVRKACNEKKSPLTETRKNVKIRERKSVSDAHSFDVKSEHYSLRSLRVPLAGDYQRINLATAFGVFDSLAAKHNMRFTENELRRGFERITRNTGFDYRFKTLSRNPLVVLDVSHNAEGIKFLKRTLGGYKYGKLFIIFGMMSDKEYGKCINELEKLNGFLILTKPGYKRSAEPEMLMNAVKNKSRAAIMKNASEAYAFAASKAGKNDMILVTGSFFLLSDILKTKKF